MAVLAVVLMRSKPARALARASGASEANAKKKVTAFVGCASKKHTFKAVQRFLDQLKAPGDVEVEVVALSDYRIGICRGCKVCFLRGEESCPLKDDRDLLIQKMMASDGVIFATPNYSFQVSAQLKLLLDRLGFVFHRPRFFGKAFTSIVVQGFYGAGKIERYLDFVGAGLGFSTVKGSCITSLEPMTEAGQREMEKLLAKQVRRFRARLFDPEPASPSLIQLIGFRAGRTCSKLTLNEHQRDYTYYRDNGWFDSDYFHPVRLGLIKRAVGAIFDRVAARKYSKQPQAPDLGPSPDAAQAHE
jgi:multimeric flavodoxin WrbA